MSVFLADPFVAMAAAAMKTTKINLGTGVLVPSNRIAPVTANCLASLNHLAPGRIHCTSPGAKRVVHRKICTPSPKALLREGIRSLRDAGYAQFAIHIRYGHEAMVEEWAEVLAGV
jgi:hypothetical protein